MTLEQWIDSNKGCDPPPAPDGKNLPRVFLKVVYVTCGFVACVRVHASLYEHIYVHYEYAIWMVGVLTPHSPFRKYMNRY